MFKRAHLYSGNVPVPETQLDDEQYHELVMLSAKFGKDKNSSTNSKPVEDNRHEEFEEIRFMPGNKVAYCIYCNEKRLLNADAIDKHLKSKDHFKRKGRHNSKPSN